MHPLSSRVNASIGYGDRTSEVESGSTTRFEKQNKIYLVMNLTLEGRIGFLLPSNCRLKIERKPKTSNVH